MLAKPPPIAVADVSDPTVRYEWDEWNVIDAYQPADSGLMARMAALSHRANVAMCTAQAEWVVWRYERLSDDVTPHQVIEAMWASVIHTAYARYTEFNDDAWRGVVRGPMRIALAIVIDLVWGVRTATPGENAAWLSNLTERVLPAAGEFLQWREGCLRRLQQHFPEPVENQDIVFSDEYDMGPWVPREAFDLTREFHPAQTRTYLERFLRTLDPSANPFLHTPEEMLAFPDFGDTPYVLPEKL